MKHSWFNILLLALLSCSENEENGETDMLEFNAILTSTILLKEHQNILETSQKHIFL